MRLFTLFILTLLLLPRLVLAAPVDTRLGAPGADAILGTDFFLPYDDNEGSLGRTDVRLFEVWFGTGSIHMGATGDEAEIFYDTGTNELKITGTSGDFAITGNFEADIAVYSPYVEASATDSGGGSNGGITGVLSVTGTTATEGIAGYFAAQVVTDSTNAGTLEGVVSQVGMAVAADGTLTEGYAVRGDVVAITGSTITTASSFKSQAAQGGGTINDLYGFYAEKPVGVTVGTYRGVFIQEDGLATNSASLFISPTGFASLSGTWAIYNDSDLTSWYKSKIQFDYTDSTASPGAATIDKPSGYSAIASGASSVVITNSLVSTGSVVWAVIDQGANDLTLTSVDRVQTATGSFTIVGNAAATADVKIKWAILN